MFKIYMLLKQNNTNIGLKIYKATAFSQEYTKVLTAGGLVCSAMCTGLRSVTLKCWL